MLLMDFINKKIYVSEDQNTLALLEDIFRMMF